MRRATSSDGYVTLAVLLTAALLAAVVSGLVAVSRPALGLVRVGAYEVAADALLEGGMATAAYLLFDAGRNAAQVDGLALRRSTGSLRLNVSDESGRIDINAAAPELLMGLYAAVRARSMTPGEFAGRIVDWRDSDGEMSGGGAEADEYRAAGKPSGPANRRFRSVAELRMVLGLSGDDFSRLEPFVTVYTGAGGVDPLRAPATVLLAVPGVDSKQVQLILQARRQGLSREEIADRIQRGSEFLSTADLSVYRVGVQVQLTGGFTDAVQAVIVAPELVGRSDYGVAAWSRVGAALRP